MGNFQFKSNRNYMKKHSSSGSGTMLGPDTSRFFGSYYTRTYTVNHGLGYAPMFRVYYEPFQDHKVMEATQDTNYALPNPPNGVRITNDGPTCLTWADDTNLYIELYFLDATLAAVSFPIYWIIYKDYGAAG